ncbi:rab-gap/tbc-related [Anaeramoeba flamelloides]|uniref:Rab-gap/tbc-related n=1 Tax=Anaeramoeba flamelloides TaxID=1746091 RepID=A0AAV8AI66_9EUKA|nr:rab-gap/tbc-related [Anaeramoeba flamelloides]
MYPLCFVDQKRMFRLRIKWKNYVFHLVCFLTTSTGLLNSYQDPRIINKPSQVRIWSISYFFCFFLFLKSRSINNTKNNNNQNNNTINNNTNNNKNNHAPSLASFSYRLQLLSFQITTAGAGSQFVAEFDWLQTGLPDLTALALNGLTHSTLVLLIQTFLQLWLFMKRNLNTNASKNPERLIKYLLVACFLSFFAPYSCSILYISPAMMLQKSKTANKYLTLKLEN